MASPLPRECLSGLDEVTGHAVNAAQTANEIIELDLIRLPPEFPDVELGSRIKVIQRGIKQQAQRYHGDIRDELYQIVCSVRDFAKKNKSFSDKILKDIDVDSLAGQQQVAGAVKLLNGNVKRIVSRFDALQENLGVIMRELATRESELDGCIADYDRNCQNLKRDQAQQTLMKNRLQTIEEDRSEITWKVVKTLGAVVLVSAVAGTGVGLLFYTGIPFVVGWAGLEITCTSIAAMSGAKCIAAGIGAGCVAGVVSTACLASHWSDQLQEYKRLNDERRRIEAQVMGIPDIAMTSIRDKIIALGKLTNRLNTQLEKVKGDWKKFQSHMQQTVDKLEDGSNMNVVFFVKEQIHDAQSSWEEALKWANALYEVPPHSDSPDQLSCMSGMFGMMGSH